MSTADALSPNQFAAMHPHLNHYRDGGMGGKGEDHSVVGYVPTHILSSMPGNDTDPERVGHYRDALRSGEGFENPAMVVFDPKSKLAYVGEGNHRVAAAAAEGISHVPARVVRVSNIRPDTNSGQGGHPASVDVGPSPFDRSGGNYWPSDIHPSHLFPGVR